jgi:hypothetical protein
MKYASSRPRVRSKGRSRAIREEDAYHLERVSLRAKQPVVGLAQLRLDALERSADLRELDRNKLARRPIAPAHDPAVVSRARQLSTSE